MALDKDQIELDEEDTGREFTLGTSTILALFFCLALAFAAVFGLGYTVGRKSVPPSVPDVGDTGLYGSKPPAGNPAIQAVPGYLSKKETADANAMDNKAYAASTMAAAATKTSVTVPMNETPAANTTVPAPITTVATPAPAPAPAAPTPAPPASPSSFIVQVAAVSHQEDADLLLNSLRSRGYSSVALHTMPQDKLLHVQIGPFANRKDADAMRARLLADGYNAIVK